MSSTPAQWMTGQKIDGDAGAEKGRDLERWGNYHKVTVFVTTGRAEDHADLDEVRVRESHSVWIGREDR